jgi:sugar lactone lactonase YvrE
MPFGISITSNDVLYISDTNNNRIVVLDLTSRTNISIIGSGPGSNSSQFNNPYGLFIKDTSLYVIDYNNYRVQKSLLNGSNPSTVPGISTSNSPFYLYVDNDDNIYLSDTFNNRVLFFPYNSTNFTTVAGNSTPGSLNNQLNKPFGVFVNQNGTIYIADYGNHRIMKWFSGATFGILTAGSGTCGSTSTQLCYPAQILVDTNEYMYISELTNVRITRWAPNSTFGVCIAACTGLIGTAANQLNWPSSIAFDSNGSLYVNDRTNHRIQKFQILSQYQSKCQIC